MVKDILINGVSIGSNAEVYTVKSVSENMEIQVIFGEKTDLPFIDVEKTDWFYDNVKYVYEHKFMVGITDITFEPNINLSRAMFVAILHRIDGEKEEDECKFEDVQSGAYYEKAVAWASTNGIVAGISATEFDPNADITREQMAAILYRYANYKKIDTQVGDNTNILSYDDYNDISEYAIPSMQWAAGSGLMVGKTETTLNPKDNATRAEAAAVFMRFVENFND